MLIQASIRIAGLADVQRFITAAEDVNVVAAHAYALTRTGQGSDPRPTRTSGRVRPTAATGDGMTPTRSRLLLFFFVLVVFFVGLRGEAALFCGRGRGGH